MHSREFTNYPLSKPNGTLAPTRAKAARAAVEEKRSLRLAREGQAARQRPIARILDLLRRIFPRSEPRNHAVHSHE